MFAQLVTGLTFAAAIGAGLMAGLFFAYSNSAVPALARMPPAQSIAAMNHVNAVILNPLFLGVFMGVAILSVLLAIAALAGWAARPVWILAAATAYLVGNIAVTGLVNVPMNVALAAANQADDAARLWAAFQDRWVFWNSVRALSCVTSLACFLLALM